MRYRSFPSLHRRCFISFCLFSNFLKTIFQIESNAELGKYLVASRDLKEGDILFSEPPLVVGPVGVTLPVCLACYNVVGDSYK